MQAITELPTDELQAAGLAQADIESWSVSSPSHVESYAAAADALSAFLRRGIALEERLPDPGDRSDAERIAGEALTATLAGARVLFLKAHAVELYDDLTGGRSQSVRLEDLVYAAAERVPGLTPSREDMEAERARPLVDKRGYELAQGLLVEYVLADQGTGTHLVETMLAPRPEALALIEEFRHSGSVDLGPARVTRRGRAAVLELCNPRHLNAEDNLTLGPTEVAVDLVLLDPECEVGVFRGAVVDHPRYAGDRIFGAGINLTHLYQGKIDFLFYLVRDLGYVNKLYRGLITDDGEVEKLWVATVEHYAIGGACQLLHVMDHVLAVRGSRLYLPARKEGIIPGASNLRLARSVGDRAARQAILSGREWTAGEPDADLLIDEVVEPGDMDGALSVRIEALTNSGLINAAANRRALRIGQEPPDLFRAYMSIYAREQAYCHLSPALVRNLERHWNAAERGD